MSAMPDDIAKLDPEPEEIKLSSGLFVRIVDLKTRQFFRLLKILTRGAGPLLMEYRLDADLTQEEFVGRLLGLVVLSIPEAEDEAIDFIRSMVQPAGLIENRSLSKQDKERNDTLWADVDKELRNPELEDTIDIIETIVKREAKDIQSLGKRLQAMFRLAERTGQTKPESVPPSGTSDSEIDSIRTASSEASAEPSTSSAPSTDGPTTFSTISESEDSDKSLPQSD
jgi:hypothetical protein